MGMYKKKSRKSQRGENGEKRKKLMQGEVDGLTGRGRGSREQKTKSQKHN